MWWAPTPLWSASQWLAVDCFALGVMVLQVLTGAVPERGTADHSVVVTRRDRLGLGPVATAAWDLAQTLVDMDPAKRPSATAAGWRPPVLPALLVQFEGSGAVAGTTMWRRRHWQWRGCGGSCSGRVSVDDQGSAGGVSAW